MAITETTNRPCTILWQDIEQAIVILRYNGCIEIKQGSDTIIVGDDNFKDFLKSLNIAYKIEG